MRSFQAIHKALTLAVTTVAMVKTMDECLTYFKNKYAGPSRKDEDKRKASSKIIVIDSSR